MYLNRDRAGGCVYISCAYSLCCTAVLIAFGDCAYAYSLDLECCCSILRTWWNRGYRIRGGRSEIFTVVGFLLKRTA